jgi:predicted glycosyltransferase
MVVNKVYDHSMKEKTVVYYVSAHGYGHGVRTCDVLNAFCEKEPEVAVTVVSGLPEEFLGRKGVREGKGSVP